MGGLRETNKFLTDSEPWKLKGDERADDRRRVRGWSCACIFVCMFRRMLVCVHACMDVYVSVYMPRRLSLYPRMKRCTHHTHLSPPPKKNN